MNRRGFVSLLVGAAGAPLVPWRGLIDPVIVLPEWPQKHMCVPGGLCLHDIHYPRGSGFVPTHLSIGPRDGVLSVGGYYDTKPRKLGELWLNAPSAVPV